MISVPFYSDMDLADTQASADVRVLTFYFIVFIHCLYIGGHEV